jgi:DNA-binding CsgD family transcriptional regulator
MSSPAAATIDAAIAAGHECSRFSGRMVKGRKAILLGGSGRFASILGQETNGRCRCGVATSGPATSGHKVTHVCGYFNEEMGINVGSTDPGLSPEAKAVYRAMLSDPGMRPEDLAGWLELPQRTVRKAVDRLTELELLVAAGSGDHRLAPAGTGLAGLLHEAEEQLRRRQREIAATRDAIAAVVTAHAQRAPGAEPVVRIDDLTAVRRRLTELVQLAVTDFTLLSPARAFRLASITVDDEFSFAAMAGQVRFRSLHQDSYRNDAETLAFAQRMAGAGGEVRTVPVVPMPMAVVDRQVALLPISSADTQLGAFEVHGGGMLAAVCALFDQLWHTATPLHEPLRRNGDGLTGQEVEVLRLLAAGLTDEAVARKLGLSARTVRRTIAALSQRLRANSRFQAGAQAARRGWI